MSAPLSLWQEFENWLDSVFGFGHANTLAAQPSSPSLQTLSTAAQQPPTQTSSALSTIAQGAAVAGAVIGVAKVAVPIITGVVGSLAGTGAVGGATAVAGTGAAAAAAGAEGVGTAATTITTGAVSGGIEIGADGSIIGVAGAAGGDAAAGGAAAAGGGSAVATGGAVAAAPVLGVGVAVAAVAIVAVVFSGIGNKDEEEKWEATQEAEFGFRYPKVGIKSPVDGSVHYFGSSTPIQDWNEVNPDGSKDFYVATHDYITGAARPFPGVPYVLQADGNYWTRHIGPPPPPKPFAGGSGGHVVKDP